MMVAASRQIRRKVATTTFNDKVIGFYRDSKHTYVLNFLQLYGTIIICRTSMEWQQAARRMNLNGISYMIANRCDDDAIYLFGSTHTLFGSTHIIVGATLFYPTTIYDSHYLIVVRHNLGKIDYVLKWDFILFIGTKKFQILHLY